MEISSVWSTRLYVLPVESRGLLAGHIAPIMIAVAVRLDAQCLRYLVDGSYNLFWFQFDQRSFHSKSTTS
jgi:hypothetical protein